MSQKSSSKATWPKEDGMIGRTPACDTIFANVAKVNAAFKVSPGKSEQRYSLARVVGTGTIFYLRKNKRGAYRLAKLYNKEFAKEFTDPQLAQEATIKAVTEDLKINQ